jgi:hypothetical protein
MLLKVTSVSITGFGRQIRTKSLITAGLSAFRRRVKVKAGYIETQYLTSFISILENLKREESNF